MRSIREQCRPRLWRATSGDGGIPLVALQTSNVWANVVTALVLFLSPAGDLRTEDPGETGQPQAEEYDLYEMEYDYGELVDEIGGVYCGVYEPCSHGEAAVIFVSLVNSTGTSLYLWSSKAAVHSTPTIYRLHNFLKQL